MSRAAWRVRGCGGKPPGSRVLVSFGAVACYGSPCAFVHTYMRARCTGLCAGGAARGNIVRDELDGMRWDGRDEIGWRGAV